MVFSCRSCNRSFCSEINYINHEKSFKCQSSKKLRDGKICCPVPKCKAKFAWMTSLYRHIKTLHANDEVEKVEAYACGICPMRFTELQELFKHRTECHANTEHGEFKLRQSAHKRQTIINRLVFPLSITTMDEGYFYAVDRMIDLIESGIAEMKLFKVCFTFFVELHQVGEDGEVKQVEVFPFRSSIILARPMMHLLRQGGIRRYVAEALGDVERNLDEFLHQGSGWIVARPAYLDAELVRVRTLTGSGECGLHLTTYKRSVGVVTEHPSGIDVDSDDGFCFYKAAVASLVDQHNRYVMEKMNTTPDYDVLLQKLIDAGEKHNTVWSAKKEKRKGKKVSVRRIPIIERAWKRELNLNVAVHLVYVDEDQVITPLQSSSNKAEADIHIVMALFHTMKGGHYALCPDPHNLFSRRVVSISDGRKRTYRRHTCYSCFSNFHSRSSLENHESHCMQPSGQTIVMPKEGQKMEFNGSDEATRRAAFEAAYILIFDFETLQCDVAAPCSCEAATLENTRQREKEMREWESLSEEQREEISLDRFMEEGLQDLWDQEDAAAGIPKSRRRKVPRGKKMKLCPHKQSILKEQQAFAYSYALMRRDGHIVKSDVYIGDDAAEHFVKTTLDIADQYLPSLTPGAPMEYMPKNVISRLYSEAEMCYLCEEQFEAEEKKVLDHDHVTGKFIGVAHNHCNLQRKEVAKLVCMSHNMSGYDSHLIIPKLAQFPERIKKIDAIPLNTQKFKTFSLNSNITFLDSMAFLPDSLDRLVENLKASGSTFPLLGTVLGGPDCDGEGVEEHKKLLVRKGVYPYSFATSIDVLEQCTELPPKEEFYNDLNQSEISDADYEHAQKVWDTFECQNMMDYTVLYVRSDVLLLAEAVYDMRCNIWNEFKLDMCAYLSLPMLAKDIMLKYTGSEIELLTDQEMSNLIQSGIRGGLSFINKRYAEREWWDKEEVWEEEEEREERKNSRLVYFDANNLYGDAMTFPLPYDDFKWMTQEEIDNFDIDNDITDKSGARGYIFEVDLEYPEELHDAHNSFPMAPHSMTITEEDISPYSRECLEAIYHRKKHTAKKLVSTFQTRRNYVVHGLNLQLYKKHGLKILKIHRGISFHQKDFIRPYIEMCTQKRKNAPTESLKNMYKLLCNALYGKMIEGVFGRMDAKFNRSEEDAVYRSSSPLFKGSLVLDENLSVSFLKKKKVYMKQSWAVGFAILELSKYRMQKFYYETIQPAFGVGGCTVLMSDTDSFLLQVETESVDEAVCKIREVMDFSNYPKDHPFYSNKKAKALGHLKNEVPNTEITQFVGLKAKTYMYMTEDGGHHVRAKGVKRSHQSQIRFDQMLGCLTTNTKHEVVSHFIRSKNHVVRLIQGKQIAFSSFDDKRFLLCPVHSVPYGSRHIPSENSEKTCPFCLESDTYLSKNLF